LARRIIVITGTPGVGKTSVSRLLASKLGALHLDVTKLALEEGIVEGMDEERETFIADLDRLQERISELVNSTDGLVIVEGHYAQEVVSRDEVLQAFVLRREPNQLREELKRRGYQGNKLLENLEAEILDVCLLEAVKACGPERVYEVDVSGRTLEDVVDELLRVLKDGGRSRVGVVDWLKRLEEEGKLQEFFRR